MGTSHQTQCGQPCIECIHQPWTKWPHFSSCSTNPHDISLNDLIEVLSSVYCARRHTFLGGQFKDSMASLTFSLTCFPSSNFSKTSLRGFPRFPVTSVGNSGSMGTMICCKLAQRASLNMIRRIDLLTEILFVHDRFSQILCETYTIVFGFSASMSTTRHGTFKWTMGVIALATAIHEVEHFILGGLDSCGLLDWLGKSIIVD